MSFKPFQRRTAALLAVFGAVVLAVAVAPALDPLFEDEAAAPELPSVAVATLTPEPASPAVAVEVTDPAEAATLRARIQAAGLQAGTEGATVLTDAAPDAEDAPSTVHAAYALITHPRDPVLDLTLEEARGILAGTEGELVTVAEAVPWLDRTVPVPNRFVRLATAAEVVEQVATTPGLRGLLPVAALEPSVRALTVEGYDPYRDPVEDSPLADRRWVAGPDAEAVAATLEWDAPPDTASEAASEADPVGFLATGELIPARCVTGRVIDLERGYEVIFDGTRDLITAADLAMSHWEPSVIDGEPTPCTQTFNMSTPPEAAVAAANAGVDVALAIGNHVGDCWPGCGAPDAAVETVQHLREAGLVTLGAGPDLEAARTPAFVEVQGVAFAFLGYDDIARAFYAATPGSGGTAPLDLDTLAEDVAAAKTQADHVIVGFSWGVEYVADPTTLQQEAARTAIEAGASLVVGNHPHWVQATQWLGDAFVAYGLGNFIFDQDWSVPTTQGAILEVGFTRDRILGLRLRPTAIRQEHLVELLDTEGPEAAEIMDRIWTATDALATP